MLLVFKYIPSLSRIMNCELREVTRGEKDMQKVKVMSWISCYRRFKNNDILDIGVPR